jgi:hypothetical protein
VWEGVIERLRENEDSQRLLLDALALKRRALVAKRDALLNDARD